MSEALPHGSRTSGHIHDYIYSQSGSDLCSYSQIKNVYVILNEIAEEASSKVNQHEIKNVCNKIHYNFVCILFI